MSYRIVWIEPGSECVNGLRYPTTEDAESAYQDLRRRWGGCPLNHRIEESTDPVNVHYPVKPEGIK